MPPTAVGPDQFGERADPAGPDDVEEFLAGKGEMFAQVVSDLHARGLQFPPHECGHQGDAASAARPHLGREDLE
ncbi:MAG: hypothetical protein ACRDZ8_04335 [Acidimicrobiales bacterium]